MLYTIVCTAIALWAFLKWAKWKRERDCAHLQNRDKTLSQIISEQRKPKPRESRPVRPADSAPPAPRSAVRPTTASIAPRAQEQAAPAIVLRAVMESSSNVDTSTSEQDSDDRDAWEGSFWEAEDPWPVEAHISFDYTDANGRQSHRVVSVRSAGGWGDTHIIIGHCHTRNATRTFRLDRIASCRNARTGEPIPDLFAYLHAIYDASPERAIERLRSEHWDVLKVLLYIAKADGFVRKAERALIHQTARTVARDDRLAEKTIDTLLRDLGTPSKQAFKVAAGRLAKLDGDTKALVFETARKMVATESTVAAEEQDALDYLDKRFAAGK